MRRDSIFGSVAPLALVLVAMTLAGCGGSASETPFPQPPIERELAARHERANAETPTEEQADSPVVATSVATGSQAVGTPQAAQDGVPQADTASAPAVTPAPEPEATPAPAF